MASALSEILELHKGRGVQSHGVVWRIEGASSRVEQCKTELLETVCRDAQPFVHYEEPSLGVTGLDGSVEVAPAFGNCPWVPPPRSWGASLGLALTAAMSLIITTMLFYCLLARKN